MIKLEPLTRNNCIKRKENKQIYLKKVNNMKEKVVKLVIYYIISYIACETDQLVNYCRQCPLWMRSDGVMMTQPKMK